MFYSIQFLRGIAALMVVMTHVAHKGGQYGTGSLSWFKIGGDGVDLFFIISGFIMCYTTHDKRMTFFSFMKNRVQRIIPLYWTLSFVALLVFIFSPHLVNSSGGRTGVLESFFLIPNGVKFLIQNGWTLSYEFYYYFIFSIFIFLTSVKSYRYLGITLTIMMLAVVGVVFKQTSAYFMFLFSDLLLEFSFGILAFVLFQKLKPGSILSTLMILFGLSYLIFRNAYGTPDVVFGKPITSGIPMFLIFLGLISLENWFVNNDGRFVRLFEQLGNCSYSLYLVHPFVLSPLAMILKKMNMLNSVLFPVLLVVGSIAAGLLTYNFLEKPLTKIIKGIDKNTANKEMSKNTVN